MEGANYMKQALFIVQNMSGPYSRGYEASLLKQLADILREAGDLVEAGEVSKEAVHISRRVYGRGHVQVAYTLISHCLILREADDPNSALLHVEEALNLLERAGSPGHLIPHSNQLKGMLKRELGEARVGLGLLKNAEMQWRVLGFADHFALAICRLEQA